MIILRQRNYGLGSKVLAVISPNAWAGKELAKFSSATKGEYKRKRLKYMLKGVLAPMSTRKMLGKAQDMHGRGYDCDEIAVRLCQQPGAEAGTLPDLGTVGEGFGG